MKSVKLENCLVKIIETQKPVLEAMGAIVKVEGCGLCGSDLVKIRDSTASSSSCELLAVSAVAQSATCRQNVILGHEIVGEIVEINSTTDFKIGDKIVMGHHYPCFECEFCKNESYSMCKTFKEVNIYPAGFSEFIKIDEGHLKNTVFKMPRAADAIELSFTEPLACCHRAIRRASIIRPSDTLTLGLGSIGLLMAQLAREFGHNSCGFDVNPSRQAFAAEFGIVPPDRNVKYDVIFMTSGSSHAIPTALSYVKDGGKIIVFSSVEDAAAAYTNNDIYYRELSVIGSYSPAPIDLKCAYNLIIGGKIKLEKISTVYSLQDIQNAVNDTVSGKIYKAYIKI